MIEPIDYIRNNVADTKEIVAKSSQLLEFVEQQQHTAEGMILEIMHVVQDVQKRLNSIEHSLMLLGMK